jgi:hypothetical protein
MDHDRACIREAVEAAVRSATEAEVDYRIVFADGSVKHLRAVGQRITDDAGRSPGLHRQHDASAALRQWQERGTGIRAPIDLLSNIGARGAICCSTRTLMISLVESAKFTWAHARLARAFLGSWRNA